MRIVILGASHWHAPCYHRPADELGHEVHIVDEDGAVVKRIIDRFPQYKGHRDYGAIDDVKPDFAVCLGRHDLMPVYINMCIEREIPFMAEKPAGLTPAVVRELADRCGEKGLFHAAPFSMRWDAPVLKIREILDSGVLGRVARMGMTYFAGPASRYTGWGCAWVLEQGRGGAWPYNLGVHLFDTLRFWGLEPSFMSGAMSSALNRGAIEDVCTFVLRTGQESYAVAEGGYCARSAGGYTFNVFAENGNLDYRSERLTVDLAGGESQTHKLPAGDSRTTMLKALLEQCFGGQKAAVDLYDMAAALEPVEAFYGARR